MRRWLAARALSLAVIMAGCGGPQPRDVILVTLDTTRADHLSAFGYERPISPELDRFARESVVFPRAWSTDSWTLPAHASILTGHYPTRHGAHFSHEGGAHSLAEVIPGKGREDLKVNVLPDDAITLAELLQERGYATAAFVGGPWLAPPFGLLQGYDVKDADVRALKGRPANLLTRAAVAWLETIPSNRRLHLLVNYFDPHSPYEPPKGFDTLPRAKEPLGVTPFGVLGGAPLSPDDHARFIDRYDGEIGFMDSQFGRLMMALRRQGRFDDALIIVVADHGESFGEHGLMEHGRWLYEEVLRVPLLIHFPGGRAGGTVVETPVSVVDLLTLVADEVGFRIPSVQDGLPVGRRRVVMGESFRDSFMLKHYGDRFDRDLVALIRWPWKLIVPSRGPNELYRLDVDPHELHDRSAADNERARKLLRAMRHARHDLSAGAGAAPGAVDDATRDALRALGYIE